MKEVLYIQRFANDFLANCINDKGVKQQVPIIETRGAVVPPVGEFPGYFVFFGMTSVPNIFGKYPLLFLCEGEYRTHGPLSQTLFNDAARMKASIIYADRGATRGKQSGFYQHLWKIQTSKKMTTRVVPAPSPEDVDYGMGIIRDWTREDAIKRPQITPTVLVRQLSEDMREGEVNPSDDRWHAFHAMRYLIAGFIKSPPIATRRPSKPFVDQFDDISTPAKLVGQGRGSRLGAWT